MAVRNVMWRDEDAQINSCSDVLFPPLPQAAKRGKLVKERLSVRTPGPANDLTRTEARSELRECLAVSGSASSLRIHADTCRITL
jgi:hypothetical protein